MATSAELWSRGKRQWWISHEGENGPKGLDVDGSPPETLAAIRNEMEALSSSPKAATQPASTTYLKSH